MNSTQKRHFLGLDGLRGIAALAVMFMHHLGLFLPNTEPPIPAGLSVDLFFMLSGFVLAYAYGGKLDRGMPWSEYMIARILRLYPMLLLGILFGAILSFTKQYIQDIVIPEENIVFLLATLFVLPYGLLYSSRQFPYDSPFIFGFNGPMWSLFFELVASAALGTQMLRIRGFTLAAFMTASIVGLAALGAWFGTIQLGSHGVIGFLGGFFRVAVPFTIGIILFRTEVFSHFPVIPFSVLGIGLSVILLAPRYPDWKTELFLVIAIFPLVISLGARVSLTDRGKFICWHLGRFSYPIYLLHFPVSRIAAFVIKPITEEPWTLILVAIVATLAASWLALEFFDEPGRRWLAARLRRRTLRAAG